MNIHYVPMHVREVTQGIYAVWIPKTISLATFKVIKSFNTLI